MKRKQQSVNNADKQKKTEVRNFYSILGAALNNMGVNYGQNLV